MSIEKGRPFEQSPKMKGIFYEAMQEKKLSESPKPLILLGFSKSSVSPLAPKCVDERCNTENVARKCDVFMYFPLLFHLKSCKKTSFSKPWYCPARGVIFEMHPAVFTVWCDSDTPASKKRRKICNRASLFSYRAEKRRFSFSVR